MIPHNFLSGLAALTKVSALALGSLVKRVETRRLFAVPTAELREPPAPYPLSVNNQGPAARRTKNPKVVPLNRMLPIIIVEDAERSVVPLSQAIRDAGFVNPLIHLPDNASVDRYLDGSGIYANRKKYPLPALILQEVSLPELQGIVSAHWLMEPPGCRHIVVIVPSGEVEARHFESAVAFGPKAILYKLQFPDSLDAMFRVLRRSCIND